MMNAARSADGGKIAATQQLQDTSQAMHQHKATLGHVTAAGKGTTLNIAAPSHFMQMACTHASHGVGPSTPLLLAAAYAWRSDRKKSYWALPGVERK